MINNQIALSEEKGTYGRTGCLSYHASGAIAAANICLLDGIDIALDDVVDKITHTFLGLHFGGCLGTRMWAIKRFLKKQGFKVKFKGRLKSYTQLFDHQYFIVWYVWFEEGRFGCQYQAGQVITKQRELWLELFNPYHQYRDPKQFKQFEKAIYTVTWVID